MDSIDFLAARFLGKLRVELFAAEVVPILPPVLLLVLQAVDLNQPVAFADALYAEEVSGVQSSLLNDARRDRAAKLLRVGLRRTRAPLDELYVPDASWALVAQCPLQSDTVSHESSRLPGRCLAL